MSCKSRRDLVETSWTCSKKVHSLNVLEDYAFMLNSKTAQRATEGDHMSRIWATVFDHLLAAGNNMVRLKTYVSLFPCHSAIFRHIY